MPDKTQINLERIRACDAEWEESKHPRSENGQFTSGSGGGAVKNVAEAFKGVKVSKATQAMKNNGRFFNPSEEAAVFKSLSKNKKYADFAKAGEKLNQKKEAAAKQALAKARPQIAAARKFAKTQSTAGAGQKMDDLTKKYIQQGKNDHAMVAMMLKSEMAMADGDFHKAVGALQRKFDDPGFGMDEDRQKKLSDILLNDVSGDAFDVMNPESTAAPKKADANKAAKEQIFKQAAAASKKTAEAKAAKEAAAAKKTLSDIDSRIAEAKRKGDIKSVSFLEAAKASAQKKAPTSKSKPTTRFDKDMAKADKSYEDFREVMQKRKSEIDVLNERLRTTKNSFVAKATKQELDRLVSEYNQLDEMY